MKTSGRFDFSKIALLVLDAAVIIYLLNLLFIAINSVLNINKFQVTGMPYILGTVSLIIIVCCPVVAVWTFHLLLVNARYDNPFNRRNVNRFNLMSIMTLLPWLLTSGWWPSVSQWFGSHQELSFPVPFMENGNLPVNGFVMALLLFGLAGIFDRGVRLREEQELTV